MNEQITTAKSGAKGSKVPSLDLIPYRALCRLAARYEHGTEKYGRDNWRKGLTDRQYIRDRAAHVMNHTARLIAKLDGHLPEDGDDDAAAIMWGGAFLCEAEFALECEQDDIADARKRIEEAGR
jgi:hypothetical protein